MALITSAAGQSTGGVLDSSPKSRSNLKQAQTLAKLQSLEKKSKNYKLPMAELAIFTQQLASLLTAGLPLVQCLEALQDQTEDPCFRIIIRDVDRKSTRLNS